MTCHPTIYRRELVDVIFEQPYCRIANLVEKKWPSAKRASRYLKGLVAIGVLQEVASGRDKLFIHPKLLQLVTRDSNEFAFLRLTGHPPSLTHLYAAASLRIVLINEYRRLLLRAPELPDVLLPADPAFADRFPQDDPLAVTSL